MTEKFNFFSIAAAEVALKLKNFMKWNVLKRNKNDSSAIIKKTHRHHHHHCNNKFMCKMILKNYCHVKMILSIEINGFCGKPSGRKGVLDEILIYFKRFLFKIIEICSFENI